MRDGWKKVAISDVCMMMKRGQAPSYTENKSVTVLNQKCIRDGKINLEFSRQSDANLKNINEWAYLKVTDTLINSTGVGTLGRVAFVKKLHEPTTVDSHITIVRPDDKEIEPSFLGLSLNFREAEIAGLAAGSSGQTELSREAIGNLIILIPPLPEQKRIINLISSVDSYMEALQQQVESAKKSRNAVLHELLTTGGDDWVEGVVGDVSVLRYGYTESAKWEPIGPHFLRITDIQDGQVNWDSVPYCKISDTEIESQKLRDGDLVFARTGATTGKSFLVTNPPTTVCASYLIRLRPDQSKVSPYYLSIFFQSEDYWQQVMAGTSGSAQGGVNASKLSNLTIQIPPLPTQKVIAHLIEVMDIHSSIIQDALNKSRDLRTSILSDLLSGEHEIPASYDKLMDIA